MEDKYLRVTMEDYSQWDVPVKLIIENRAKYYFSEFGDEFENMESAIQDTVDFFSDEYEIHNWAANNMNWDEVVGQAIQVTQPRPADYEDGWGTGEWEVVTV